MSTQVMLECLHQAIFPGIPPKLGETVYCRTCSEYREVVTTIEQFAAKCRTGRCTFHQQTGQDKELAVHKATVHLRNRPQHIVSVLDGVKEIDRISNDDPSRAEQDTLPLDRAIAMVHETSHRANTTLRISLKNLE